MGNVSAENYAENCYNHDMGCGTKKQTKPEINLSYCQMDVSSWTDTTRQYVTRLDSIFVDGKLVNNVKRALFLISVISESGLKDNLSYNILSNGV